MARSISGVAGVRALSKGPPGAARISMNARKLMTSSSGRRKRRRLAKNISRVEGRGSRAGAARLATREGGFALLDGEASVKGGGAFGEPFHLVEERVQLGFRE